MKVEDVEENVRYLESQGLVEVKKNRYRIKEHLSELVEKQRNEQ